jgi:hypothetical protein
VPRPHAINATGNLPHRVLEHLCAKDRQLRKRGDRLELLPRAGALLPQLNPRAAPRARLPRLGVVRALRPPRDVAQRMDRRAMAARSCTSQAT